MYELDAVLELINNLDQRKAIRRFGPVWAIVVINPNLQVEAVKRYQRRPQVSEVKAFISQYGDCAYFYTQPGMYDSLEKLKTKISACEEAF
jgi:hypothetical protein